MDQRRIAGLGNIYVAEALFRAGIHPAARPRRVRGARRELLAAIRAVLEGGIARRGTTLRDYVDADGRSGDNAAALLVYGRAGEACGRCGTVIKRRVDAGRSTFFCPGCQSASEVAAASGQSAPRRNAHIRRTMPTPRSCRLDYESFQRPRASRKSGKATPAAAERSIDFDDGVGQIRIGRRADLELSLPFSPLSGVHARLLRASDNDQKTEHWVLEDLGSTNGTYVGGERLKPGIKRPADGGRADQARRDPADLRWRGSG